MEESILARDLVTEYTTDYAMYVATNRSIISLMDGLKPVWRRCVNAADDLKLYHNKKHMKVSKLAGDVMGSYHPHGGANPVLLAQPFRMRYPLFDGQGNYGSPDLPDSYAAARYLEIRLSKFCEDFYLESTQYADKEDNYDGRLKETTLYYPALPGCLFTGASGIAIGFSAEIPAHTITDVGNSLLAYIKNPESTKYLEGLYPETCEKSIVLTPLPEIRKIYETGEGSVRYKASTHYETIDGQPSLIVDAFPPGFSKKRLETPFILDAVDKGLLEVSNESAENIRYVFTSPDKNILEALEDRLTSSVGYRMYIEHRGVIRLYKLKEIYQTFIEEKSLYIVRKYSHLSQKYSQEYQYYDILRRFKLDKSYIRSMVDKDTEEVISDIQNKYQTSREIALRILNSSIRSLLKDNNQEILDKLQDLESSIEECASYIKDPKSKIIKDIKDLMKTFSKDQKRASHIENISDKARIKYRGKNLDIKLHSPYFVGYTDNKIVQVYGNDLVSMDLSDVYLEDASYDYYFLYDERGCCTVTREVLSTSGSKLNSDHLSGILGMKQLTDISIKQGNGKVYKDVKWSLRQKQAYIRLSKESEPPFQVISNKK